MSKPLNVLLITTDQMRRDHMGCGGNGVIRTPNLDALAASGVCLDRAYVSNPLCMPNRSTIATGRLPRNHRCWCNGIPLPETERTMADVLNEQGYHTALLGKGHLTCFGYGSEHLPEGPVYDTRHAWLSGKMTPDWRGPYYGFSECQLVVGHGPNMMSLAHYRAWLDEHFPGAVERAQSNHRPSPTGALQCFTPELSPEAHSSTWLGEIGSEHLRARARDGRPFLCWVSFPDPHHPFCPPAPYDTMHDPADVAMPRFGAEALDDKPAHFRRAYEAGENWAGINYGEVLRDVSEAQLREIIARTYGMISLVDENVGRLLRTLEETNLADNTVVIFTSDHGDLMGDCGLIFKGPFHLEGLINVPMIWRVPGGAEGMHSDGLFSSCDITPTVLSLCGAEVPAWMDGMAQTELVGGGRARRDAAFVEFKSMYHEELNLRTVVAGDRKLTYYPGMDCGELYDMTAEAPEARNLYNDGGFAGERRMLEDRLLSEEVLRQDRSLWPLCHA